MPIASRSVWVTLATYGMQRRAASPLLAREGESILAYRCALVDDRPSEAQTPVTSVSWSNDGSYLAIGNDAGEVEIWDVEEGKKMRVMGGHQARIPSMSWHGHVLSSGCKDGSIYHHDVRIAKHKVMELAGHSAEVRFH